MSKTQFSTEVFIPRTKEYDHLVTKQIGKFGWCKTEKDGFHFVSALPVTDDMNDHLIWIFMILEHSRKLLRTMTQHGVPITCKCKWNKKRPVQLKAKALGMAHLLGISLEIH